MKFSIIYYSISYMLFWQGTDYFVRYVFRIETVEKSEYHISKTFQAQWYEASSGKIETHETESPETLLTTRTKWKQIFAVSPLMKEPRLRISWRICIWLWAKHRGFLYFIYLSHFKIIPNRNSGPWTWKFQYSTIDYFDVPRNGE